MIKTVEEIKQEIQRVQIIRQPERIPGILMEWIETIIDEIDIGIVNSDPVSISDEDWDKISKVLIDAKKSL